MGGHDSKQPERPESKKTVHTSGQNAANTVSFAKSVRLAQKGEDYACELVGESPVSAFAIFDGHSGRSFAEAASKEICQGLLEAGAPFTADKVEEAFWKGDQEIGCRPGEISGCTAQVMQYDRFFAEAALHNSAPSPCSVYGPSPTCAAHCCAGAAATRPQHCLPCQARLHHPATSTAYSIS